MSGIITNKFLSNSKTGRKNKMTYDIDMQFEYVLQEMNFYCENCHKRITIFADDSGTIKERNTLKYKCKCGNLYKIPSHYVNSIHNKKGKLLEKGE